MQIVALAPAPANMSVLFAVEDSQVAEQRTRLKLVSVRNMYDMSVTAETSHAERSWLKAVARANMSVMLVTAETSHAPMAEPFCCPGQRPSEDLARHASTAALSASRDVKTAASAIRAIPNSATVRRRAPRGRVAPPARGATCSEWE